MQRILRIVYLGANFRSAFANGICDCECLGVFIDRRYGQRQSVSAIRANA
jgi:hypothetical protein